MSVLDPEAEAIGWQKIAAQFEEKLTEAYAEKKRLRAWLARISYGCTLPADDFQRATRKAADAALAGDPADAKLSL